MAAVNMKLSRQDAKFLQQTLDAVSAASRTMEVFCREHPTGPGKNDAGRPIGCTDCKARENNARLMSLLNASPFGDFKGMHAFVLRISMALHTTINIADQHSE